MKVERGWDPQTLAGSSTDTYYLPFGTLIQLISRSSRTRGRVDGRAMGRRQERWGLYCLRAIGDDSVIEAVSVIGVDVLPTAGR